jgi:flavin-dependent dehydrogenase
LSETLDVVVVGGGPAGLAVAGALAQRGRRVALFERDDYASPRVGESLGGEVGPLLAELGASGVVGDFLSAQVPFRELRSAWGSDVLEERHSIVHPLGEGVHVDRARFDARLAEWAESVGVSVRCGVGRCAVTQGDSGIRVTPERGAFAEGRVFVDASGRGAPAGRNLGSRRWLACDRQVALVTRLAGADRGTELLLEAAEDGWWYSVPQPDSSLVVVLVTDADLVPAGGRAMLHRRHAESLARTTHTAARTRGLRADAIRVVRAESGFLLPSHDGAWWAVGDAAMAVDPLAGNGVARALRSARDVASAIESGHAPSYDFAQYLDRRAEIYLHEARWPDAPFWARRRPVAWKNAAITLDPRTLLRTVDPARDLAHVEALLPPRAIAAALETLADARPAHEAMTRLREVAPLGDRRLLVGLQELVARGAVAAV